LQGRFFYLVRGKSERCDDPVGDAEGLIEFAVFAGARLTRRQCRSDDDSPSTHDVDHSRGDEQFVGGHLVAVIRID
jgi:hypothetical protein